MEGVGVMTTPFNIPALKSLMTFAVSSGVVGILYAFFSQCLASLTSPALTLACMKQKEEKAPQNHTSLTSI